jgi:putative ABC transport system permease protein
MQKKWARFWQRSRRDADLRQELDQYIEQETANRIAAGLSPEDARDAAIRKLGNVTRIREDLFEQNSIVVIETLWQDVAYGCRLLRRNRGMAAVAILSIALGIGANASVFTLLDQLILRPLPVDQPHQLVLVTAKGFQYGGAWGTGDELSYPRYEDLRDHNDVFSGMFSRFALTAIMSVAGSAERVRGELVSGTYFPVLGVTPLMGRVFDRSDDTPPAGRPYVVLSHRYWQERFRSDPSVIGTAVLLNNQPLTIVGVAREGFHGTNLGAVTDVFVPLVMTAEVTGIANPLSNRRMRWLNVFGRLQSGGTAAQAQAGLQPFYGSRLAFEVKEDAFERAPARDKERFVAGTVEVTPAAYGKSELRAQLERPLWTLTAIGIGVLFIACANVANLLLSGSGARRREIAVRLALGATRRRVVRQLLVESVLLGVAGGAAGVVIATWGAQGLLAFFADPDVSLTISAWPDARILAINVSVSVLIGVLFGLAPAWQSSRPDVAPVLKAESAAVVGGGSAHLRKGLVVVQVALSMLLLAGAGLFVRSLNNLLTIDAGFDAARLLFFSVSPASSGYQPAQSKTYAKALLERVRATPGVAGAGFASHELLRGGSWNERMTIEGRPYDPDRRPLSHNNWVSPGYFSAMGIRLIAGRDFDSRDEQRVEPGSPLRPPSVVIVNEQFVRQYVDGREPLGVHVGFGANPGTPTPIEIVGVVTTAKYTTLQSQPQAQLYFPYFEAPSIGGLIMYVRTAQTPGSLVASMREAARQVDPRVPLFDVRTMDEQIERSLVNERLVASLSSILSVLATILAMVGLYGVMSYTVARRTREIAIRLAFGAVSSKVAALIARDTFALVISGMLLALPLYWWLNGYVRSQLYQVSPTDVTSIATALGLLLSASILAVLVPSRRALRVNPLTALRDE